MKVVYIHGIVMAETLQMRTMNLEKIWLFITHLGDPKSVFLIFFPFTYFISRRAGVAVLWVAAITEWLNLVLKWMLFGERPFWWIGESGLFVNKPPKVQQFPCTCETGPGSPSGHVMVTAAAWWVVVPSLGSHLYIRTGSLLSSVVPYLLYVLLLVSVGLSRIFILAHFPHQVVAGSIAGFLSGVVLSRRVPEGRPLLFFMISGGLLLGTLTLHAVLQHLGMDLSWSVTLAKKWCTHPEWVRIETSAFSSLAGDCGVLLGVGLAQYYKPSRRSLPWGLRVLSFAISSMGLYLVNQLPKLARLQSLFYVLFFVKFATVPLIVMVIVPQLVHLFIHKNKSN